MDLKTFVAETILQIIEGVADAQTRGRVGARVNPHLNVGAEVAAKSGLLMSSGDYAQLVQFDVAVTATEGTGTKGGIGVVVGAFTLGSTGQSQAESSASSRVKFAIPVVLPPAPRP